VGVGESLAVFCREPGGSISGGEWEVEADALERDVAGIE